MCQACPCGVGFSTAIKSRFVIMTITRSARVSAGADPEHVQTVRAISVMVRECREVRTI